MTAQADTQAAAPALIVVHCAYKEAGVGYQFLPHTHALHQWYAVLSGQVIMDCDGEAHVLDAEQSILFAPGMYRAPRAGKRPPCYFYVNFQNMRLDLGGVLGRVLTPAPELRQDLHALAEELRQPPEANSDALIEALTVRLLVSLTRGTLLSDGGEPPVQFPLNATYHEQLVRQVETFMSRNLHRELTRDELARSANVSPAHLGRIFRSVLGKSPGQRLAEIRLAHAKYGLLNSTMSVSQVALESGYQSFSHFSKIFKQAFGITPSDYRRFEGHIWQR